MRVLERVNLMNTLKIHLKFTCYATLRQKIKRNIVVTNNTQPLDWAIGRLGASSLRIEKIGLRLCIYHGSGALYKFDLYNAQRLESITGMTIIFFQVLRK